MIGDALYTHLTTTPGVSSIVGDRVFPGIAPELTPYPLVQFHQVSGPRFTIMHNAVDLRAPVIQIDSFAKQDSGGTGHVRQAAQLAEAVEMAMRAFQGVIAGVNVQCALPEGEATELVEVDATLARTSQDYRVFWKEAP